VKTIAIVGRPNVGKSSLFNRLAGRMISIVHDQPGVTRDRIAAGCRARDIPYTLFDTGGIGAQLDDGFTDQVRAEAEIAVESSDLVLFVVDGREGLTPLDHELAVYLRQTGRPFRLVVNKIDSPKQEMATAEFSALGLEHPAHVSAEQGRGMDSLEGWIHQQLVKLGAEGTNPDSDADAPPELPLKVAIVGRPNVGKSSLINAILRDRRTIVSDIAGTTRDAVDVPYERKGKPYILIDTAGIRRRTKLDSSVEIFSVMRTERSIRRADLVALVIDASSGATTQDQKIGSLIVKELKPSIVVINKFDLFHPNAPAADRIALAKEELLAKLFFLNYAPAIMLSAKSGQDVKRFFTGIDAVREAARRAIPTAELNRLLQEAIAKSPPPQERGRRFNLLYVTRRPEKEGAVARPLYPLEYLLFCNRPELLSETYARYLENTIRARYDLAGLPLRLTLRGKGKQE
jgi:GTPase